ncbi:MAG: hypothetical protein HQK52_18190 [Oligoflexia bacterium]|nr:hypothetical protein [Oligoflexia bacterium]
MFHHSYAVFTTFIFIFLFLSIFSGPPLVAAPKDHQNKVVTLKNIFSQSGIYTKDINRKNPTDIKDSLDYQIARDSIPFSISYNPILEANAVTKEYPLHRTVSTDQGRHSFFIYDNDTPFYSSEESCFNSTELSDFIEVNFFPIYTLLKNNILQLLNSGKIKKSVINDDLIISTIFKAIASRTQTFDADVIKTIFQITEPKYKDRIVPSGVSRRIIYNIVDDQIIATNFVDFKIMLMDQEGFNPLPLGVIRTERKMIFIPTLGIFLPETIRIQLPN